MPAQPQLNLTRNYFGTNTIANYAWNGTGSEVTSERIERTVQVMKYPRVTPGYRELVRRKAPLPVQPYLHRRVETIAPFGEIKIERFAYMGWDIGYKWYIALTETGVIVQNSYDFQAIHDKWYDVIPNVQAEIRERAIREASLKLRLKAKDEKINLAVAAAEFNQTLKMITTFARTADKLLHSLRKGDLSGAARDVGLTVSARRSKRFSRRMTSAKTETDIKACMSSGILAIQYGIRPLINDVIGAAEHLAQKNLALLFCRVSAQAQAPAEVVVNVDSGYGVNVHAVASYNCRVRYTCNFRTDESIHGAAQLGMFNPLMVAWEKMPWSFVIDWVLPVGKFLSSLDATLGLQFIDGSESIKTIGQEDFHEVIATNPNKSSGNDAISGSIGRHKTFEEFERNKLSSFPPVFLPRFKSPLGLEHAINALALLEQNKQKLFMPIR